MKKLRSEKLRADLSFPEQGTQDMSSLGDSFFANTGADASGHSTGKSQYWYSFSKKYQRTITSTGAKFW